MVEPSAEKPAGDADAGGEDRYRDAANVLTSEGIGARVLEVHTLKPREVEAFLQAVREEEE
jgi:transketolase C-terminal domain/subunit